MIRRVVPILLLALGAGCSTLPEGQRSTEPATGPPEVRPATVERHALQFDEEEPVRPAGSQEELAASAYIVAHLTDAGYVSRLDAVPVEDLVRSTNVVALPPSGEEPKVLVVVSYDSTETSPPRGYAVGTWLEVARALRAVEAGHSVQFVALGAEHTDVGEGRLGSRRLLRQLLDEGAAPETIVIDVVGHGPFRALGYASREMDAAASKLGFSPEFPTPGPDAGETFAAAGLDVTTVSGPVEEVGPVLLEYLSGL